MATAESFSSVSRATFAIVGFAEAVADRPASAKRHSACSPAGEIKLP